MCGIAGFFHTDSERKCDSEVIQKMIKVITYRGPDGEGYFVKNNLALGHRRLSIIDLSTGDQPMFSDDKKIAIVYNGEIYNYIELREELRGYGYKFRTNSDTEVIIKSYQKWGLECQNKLNGMWAFALWDESRKQLILSRDRIGEKPLHYIETDKTVIFGSEIKSILAYGIPRKPNLKLMEIYLTLGYIPAPYTFFENIHKVRAGYCIVISPKGTKEHRYWDLPEIDENHMVTNKKEIYQKFTDLFTDSVKIRMRSDVPYGAFLSGGLDSSSIVALMSKNSSFPIETFTIGFDVKSYDERELAKRVARKFRTNHHEHMVKPGAFSESLINVVNHYDEPFGDSSAIPTGHVSKFASEKVKMVLTGDGGDEVLSGYTNYQGEKFASYYQNLPTWLKTSFPFIVSQISKPFRGSIRYKLNRMINVCNTSNMDFQSRYLSKASFIDIPIIKDLTSGQEFYPVEDFLNDFLKGCNYNDPFYKLMYLNLKLSLPDEMLVKVDRMSMAYSLETRTPFLDYRLIEFMTNVHKSIKMNHFERKTILRETIGKELPGSILNAPKKGFTVPLREWFKGNTLADNIDYLGNGITVLNNNTINKIIQMNMDGEKDCGNFIWMLFVLKKVLEL